MLLVMAGGRVSRQGKQCRPRDRGSESVCGELTESWQEGIADEGNA